MAGGVAYIGALPGLGCGLDCVVARFGVRQRDVARKTVHQLIK